VYAGNILCLVVSAVFFNPLSPELNPICYLVALLAHDFLHVSRIRVKSLTLRLLMPYIYIYIYIYGAPILDVSRSHTTTQHSR
jgi:transposase